MDDTHVNNLCNYGLFLCEIKQQYTAAETYYKQSLYISHNKHTNTLYNYAVMLDTTTIPPATTSATTNSTTTATTNSTTSAYNTNTTTATDNTTPTIPNTATAPSTATSNTNTTTNISYTSINRKQEAEVYYRKCIELDCNHSYAMYNLAVLLEGREKMYKLSQVSSAIAPSSSSSSGSSSSSPRPAPTNAAIGATTASTVPLKLTSITEGKENVTDADNTIALPTTTSEEPHPPITLTLSSQQQPPPPPTRKEIGEWYRLAMVSAPQDAAISADYGRYIRRVYIRHLFIYLSVCVHMYLSII